MEYVSIVRRDSCALVTLARGKVNALDQRTVAELSATFAELSGDDSVTSIVLTGRGKFFSFGLDVPALYDLPPEEFTLFLRSFCRLTTTMFLFPKPIVAAVNGHAIAGGCMLLLPCDVRIAAETAMTISLNEVTLGASLFAGTVEQLRYLLSNRAAEKMLLTGASLDLRGVLDIGLVDSAVSVSTLEEVALAKARELSAHYGPGFRSLRQLIRGPIADRWRGLEEASIDEFVRIWYSPETRARTKLVQIRS